MQPYKAVLFDLDGTMWNAVDGILRTWNEVVANHPECGRDLTDSVNTILQQHGFPLRDAPEIRSFLGNGADALLHASLPEDTDEETFALCLVEYKAYYQQHMEDKTRPYEGIWELLDSLRAAGIKTAVASNKFYTAVQGLCEKYFSGKVNVAVGECQTETLHIRRKPSPDMLFMAAEQLGVPLTDCVYIGDSEVDVETAQNAGIDCICVSWGFRDTDVLLRAGAKAIVDSPQELMEKLL